MSSPSDRLYQIDTVPEDFDFNKRVVEVFDDMLDRSIPFYQDVIAATAQLLHIHLEQGDSVCDLGCATGTSLIKLARLLRDKKISYTGIDSSEAMLEKARLKAEYYSAEDTLSFYLWHGENDNNVPVSVGRYVADAIPNCRAIFVEDEGHFSLPYHHMREFLNVLV